MSYCAILEFSNNELDNYTEFSNAWGGAARIWTSLFDRYLKDSNKPYDSWLGREDRSLWDLAKRKDLPLFERAVHTSTFDYAMIYQENFTQFTQHLREFVLKYPVPGNVDHLNSWADLISQSSADFIGFHQTSVSENPWYIYDDEEESLYDFNTGTKHFEVYNWLESLAED